MSEPWADHSETHVSAVFLAGRYAYKQLKPLKNPFLDHSTLAKRKAGAELEVELNQRLAPDVYLGVSPVMDGDNVVDHLIVMQRLPAARRLSTLAAAAAGTPSHDFDDCLRAVARAVAAFHAGLEPDAEAVEIAGVDRERQRWHNNLDELAPLGPTVGIDDETLSEIRWLADSYLEHRDDLFEKRAAAGMARDGHGDLLADDIFCLDDGPRILDCLAFDPGLRKGDVLADVAFLVMDIERLAGPRPAQRLLRWYQEFTDEHHPASLAHFYVAYRALVRAKVTAMRFNQTGDDDDRAQTQSFVAQCLDHLERARPRLVLVGGGPGTGKSTVAEAVGEIMGWPVLSSDELRKDLVDHDHHSHAFAAPDQGIYRPEVTAATYAELCAQASQLLQNGESVVLDASWARNEHRAAARAVATSAAAAIIELQCMLDPAVAKERIVRRMASPWTVSDATPEIVDHFEHTSDPWPEAVHLDTSKPVLRCRSDAMKAVLGF